MIMTTSKIKYIMHKVKYSLYNKAVHIVMCEGCKAAHVVMCEGCKAAHVVMCEGCKAAHAVMCEGWKFHSHVENTCITALYY